jgi:Globin
VKFAEAEATNTQVIKGDMIEQGRLLMAMIGIAVDSLDKLETIVPAVQDLGRRHATYGVHSTHYDTVASALLWTLGQGLGNAFTPPVGAAWTGAYTILATVMTPPSREAPGNRFRLYTKARSRTGMSGMHLPGPFELRSGNGWKGASSADLRSRVFGSFAMGAENSN